MTTVLNPLNCFQIGGVIYYWFLLGTRNRIHYRTFLVKLQKAAIREVSGKRNGKRKRPRNRFSQITAIREVSGKRNGKGETDYQKTRSPGRSGRFREGFREEMRAP